MSDNVGSNSANRSAGSKVKKTKIRKTPVKQIKHKLLQVLTTQQIEDLDWPVTTALVNVALVPPLDARHHRRLQKFFSSSQLELLLEPFIWKPQFVMLAVVRAMPDTLGLSENKHLPRPLGQSCNWQ